MVLTGNLILIAKHTWSRWLSMLDEAIGGAPSDQLDGIADLRDRACSAITALKLAERHYTDTVLVRLDGEQVPVTEALQVLNKLDVKAQGIEGIRNYRRYLQIEFVVTEAMFVKLDMPEVPEALFVAEVWQEADERT